MSNSETKHFELTQSNKYQHKWMIVRVNNEVLEGKLYQYHQTEYFYLNKKTKTEFSD